MTRRVYWSNSAQSHVFSSPEEILQIHDSYEHANKARTILSSRNDWIINDDTIENLSFFNPEIGKIFLFYHLTKQVSFEEREYPLLLKRYIENSDQRKQIGFYLDNEKFSGYKLKGETDVDFLRVLQIASENGHHWIMIELLIYGHNFTYEQLEPLIEKCLLEKRLLEAFILIKRIKTNDKVNPYIIGLKELLKGNNLEKLARVKNYF